VYLPLDTQHLLLVKVQAILEEACYAFGHKMMGDILQKEGWDCPESVELNIWAWVFRCNEDKFDADKLVELGKPFPELLDSIAQLRHTAVHRVRVSANKVQQFVTEAESLATVLRNAHKYFRGCDGQYSRLSINWDVTKICWSRYLRRSSKKLMLEDVS
jgi:hypothetical protein